MQQHLNSLLVLERHDRYCIAWILNGSYRISCGLASNIGRRLEETYDHLVRLRLHHVSRSFDEVSSWNRSHPLLPPLFLSLCDCFKLSPLEGLVIFDRLINASNLANHVFHLVWAFLLERLRCFILLHEVNYALPVHWVSAGEDIEFVWEDWLTA